MTVLETIDKEAVRQQIPVVQQVAYLNTGTAGPLAEPTIRAMAEEAAAEAHEGRIGMAGFMEFFQTLGTLRSTLAAFVGAADGEVGLTHNTTEGMNIGILGLDWKPGDRVVTTTLEHGGALIPLYHIHRRYGVEIEFADVGLGGREETLQALENAIQPGTRMVVVSHVSWSTGAILPLAEIAHLAHRAGSLVVVDGAQSIGAIPVSMHDTGADVYAFPGQKWLCGPEGTGGVYVNQNVLDQFSPTFTGFFGTDHDAYQVGDVTSLVYAPTAGRYEVASVYRPGLKGLLAAVRFLNQSGPIFPAIENLARHFQDRVSAMDGVEMLTPDADHLSGLVSFRFPNVDPMACVQYLTERRVLIRSIPDNGALRVSCGFYNTEEEVDRVVELIDEYRSTL